MSDDLQSLWGCSEPHCPFCAREAERATMQLIAEQPGPFDIDEVTRIADATIGADWACGSYTGRIEMPPGLGLFMSQYMGDFDIASRSNSDGTFTHTMTPPVSAGYIMEGLMESYIDRELDEIVTALRAETERRKSEARIAAEIYDEPDELRRMSREIPPSRKGRRIYGRMIRKAERRKRQFFARGQWKGANLYREAAPGRYEVIEPMRGPQFEDHPSGLQRGRRGTEPR